MAPGSDGGRSYTPKTSVLKDECIGQDKRMLTKFIGTEKKMLAAHRAPLIKAPKEGYEKNNIFRLQVPSQMPYNYIPTQNSATLQEYTYAS